MRSLKAAVGDCCPGPDAEMAAAAAGPLVFLSCAAKLSMFCSALRTSSVMSWKAMHGDTSELMIVCEYKKVRIDFVTDRRTGALSDVQAVHCQQ